MTIDTKRLKTDAAYWDECGAPEDATHVDSEKPNPYHWLKKYGDKWFSWSGRDWWEYRPKKGEIDRDFIPRPTKPAAPEWDGDGFPPTNERIDILGTPDGSWSVGVVDYVDHKHCVWHWDLSPSDTMYNLVRNMQFRPIRTKEQREREEVDAVIRKAYLDGASGHIGGLAAITDAILSRYNLEPKP